MGRNYGVCGKLVKIYLRKWLLNYDGLYLNS
jgi:hypothetical protein